MGTEIERKFLLASAAWRREVRHSERIVQGYLANTERASIRVRLADGQAQINIKSMTLGAVRAEFDYPVPAADARILLDQLCLRPLIEKLRHHVQHAGMHFEIDEFGGDNAGLVVAELELDSEQQDFVRPDWLGAEVTDDSRYYNVSLLEHPYRDW